MITVSADLKLNAKTEKALGEAPEKITREIARRTLDLTGSSKVTAYDTGKTEQSMFEKGVQGDFNSGLYIGDFTDYAGYVYFKNGVNWTNPNTKTRWFEFIWTKHGKSIINSAVKEFKI